MLFLLLAQASTHKIQFRLMRHSHRAPTHIKQSLSKQFFKTSPGQLVQRGTEMSLMRGKSRAKSQPQVFSSYQIKAVSSSKDRSYVTGLHFMQGYSMSLKNIQRFKKEKDILFHAQDTCSGYLRPQFQFNLTDSSLLKIHQKYLDRLDLSSVQDLRFCLLDQTGWAPEINFTQKKLLNKLKKQKVMFRAKNSDLTRYFMSRQILEGSKQARSDMIQFMFGHDTNIESMLYLFIGDEVGRVLDMTGPIPYLSELRIILNSENDQVQVILDSVQIAKSDRQTLERAVNKFSDQQIKRICPGV